MLRRNVIVAAAVIPLAALLMYMVWGNYSSQVKLQQAAKERFAEFSAREASSLAHFLMDRRNDIEDLSSSRELLAYYENKGLGMSKEYGLWASQVAIAELLDRFVRRKTMHGKRLYRRMAYVDEDGNLLADDQGVPEDPTCCTVAVPAVLDSASAAIRLEDEDGVRRMAFYLPFVFRSKRVGTLVAWLNTEAILSLVMEDLGRRREHWFNYLVFGPSLYSPLHTVPAPLARLAASGWPQRPGEVVARVLPVDTGEDMAFLAVRSEVAGTDFSLLSLASEPKLLGTLSPGELLVYTILLALLLLGGAATILWSSARNLVLGAKVEEAGRQALRIEEKNRQLEEEVTARKAAEAALRENNDALEERVGKRTAALEDQARALSREVAERREAESIMRFIFNNTHDAIIIHDLEGKALDVNERMLELYRMSREEALSLDIPGDISGPGVTPGEVETIWKRVVGGESVTREWVARRPEDGHLFDVLVSLNRIDMGGKAVVFANVHDISEEKRRLNEQQEHQEFLNTIFEGIGAAIFVFDPGTGKTVDCNVVGERLLSMTREEILDASCKAHIQFSGQAAQDLLCPERHDRNEYEEGALALSDGTSLPVSLHSFDILIGGKEHMVQVVFDIAERKTLERKLNIAQKLESLGQLASGIAHEINTPIQYVGDSIHFVKDALEDMFNLVGLYEGGAEKAGAVEEQREEMDYEFVREEMPKACDRALDGVRRVATIVLAMKNFSHPGEEEARPVDINRAIENTVIVTRNEWKYAADLETRLAPDLPLVTGFPGGLNQVLLNIIINAAHSIAGNEATGDKGLITVATSVDGSFVEVRITDTGCGIPKENLPKIFDPFFTTKEVGKGTGQGLAIVHDIVVEKHGGTIDVESEVGVGTTFIARLPIDGPPA
ncbi:ATP-binding protein [Pseudodesulfovibrio sp.]|uniref:ATP-binding protein n=1 Tax=Pseudodesulfovibrio sp. TaxID=2035812 RepID=UPI002602077C|nr:ATP-binding protein [Pseudodesulfovibrio sp.]MDD3311594.1 PAS domain S-box protein [Pseudodesulfovibrio sp.]